MSHAIYCVCNHWLDNDMDVSVSVDVALQCNKYHLLMVSWLYWLPYVTQQQVWARILVQVTIYRRLLIGRDGHLDQSEAYDIS